MSLLLALLLACAGKPDDSSALADGGADGGAPDGGAPDGGAPDGGAPDGGGTDGGGTDGGVSDGGGATDGGASDARPSFVFILTDDQRHDMMDPLPETVARIFEPGLELSNAIVNTPLCCPARASILAGGFLAHDTGVLKNEGSQGGFSAFDDSASVGLHFQAAGYQTAFIGKYLNLYTNHAPYIPPGWNRFVGTLPHSDWYLYETALGSTTTEPGTGELVTITEYNTTYVHEQALAFLDEVGDDPFLLMIWHLAPHHGAQPRVEDDAAYAGTTWRGGAWNEPDVSDKPAHIQGLARMDEDAIAAVDEEYQNALESLLEVDRTVVELIDALEASGRIDDTIVVFTSDNGKLFGEHRISGKGVPYQESIRVPLAIRAPGGPSGVSDDRLVSTSTDVLATFYELAGIDAPTGGVSFAPLLRGEEQPRQEALFIEGYATAWSPDYNGLLTERYKYVEYVSGEVELYDLGVDPTEEENRAGDPTLAHVQAELAAALDAQKALVVLPATVRGEVGTALSAQLEHWGGAGEVTYTTDDPLPDGLSLSASGLVSGVPTTPGSWSVDVTVTDSAPSPYDGRLPAFTRTIWMGVGAGALPGLLAPPETTRSGDRATIRLSLSESVPLRAWLGYDPSLDLNPVELAVRDGRIEVSGLADRDAWVRIDGLPEPLRVALGR